MITDVLLASLSVLLSLVIALCILRSYRGRAQTNGAMVGLALTVLHMILSLVLPAIAWIARAPSRPVVYLLTVLVFYWVSLIILVMIVIRWMRRSLASDSAADGHFD